MTKPVSEMTFEEAMAALEGVVTQLDARGVELEFRAVAASRAPLPVHLVIALPRPKVAARILEAATTLGVVAVSLINSWRVDKS